MPFIAVTVNAFPVTAPSRGNAICQMLLPCVPRSRSATTTRHGAPLAPEVQANAKEFVFCLRR